MMTLTLRGLWARKRRLAGTFLAVFLGVAFLTGTVVLGDTMRASFDDLFTEANAGTDAVVRRATDIQTDPGEAQTGLVPESLVEDLEAVDGVAAAEGSIEGYGQLLGRDGEALGGNGPPTVAGNWIADSELNPYRLAEGRVPRADDEVVVNRAAADDGDLGVGDTTTLLTPEPVEVEIVGLATFGSEDGFVGITFTAFTLDAAQQYLTKQPGQVSTISVRGEAGGSQDDLIRGIRTELPDGIEVISGNGLTDENISDINKEFLDFFTTFLVVFACVALLVATFSIHNTFSILVAQRTRESALLRAVGARRSQILSSVITEAILIGIVGSVVGVVGGLGIAGLLKGLFDAMGFSLPAGDLAVDLTAVVFPIVVGIVVTLVAGAAPALKAARVAPLAALRDVAVEPSRASALRALAGGAVTATGVLVVLTAVLGSGDSVLGRAGLGALLTFVGVVVLGPVVARPVAGVIGVVPTRLRGITGVLARENAMRNPRRTASTASALMIGVGVVTLFTVFAASLKTAVDDSVSQSFRGDLVVTSGVFGGQALSPLLASDIGALPEVETATGLGTGRALVNSDTETFSIVEPSQLDNVLDLEVSEGSVGDLRRREIAVSETVAEDNDWTVGTSIPVAFLDGTTTEVRIGAIYRERDIAGNYLISREGWRAHAVQDLDTTVLVALAPAVELEAGKAAVQEVVDDYGSPDVQDRDEYIESTTTAFDSMLNVVYVLLGLAILIALMGIANTLSLAVYERTRELGLLRAVGESRRQLRSMIRWESVITAVFGTIGGLVLGVFLGWALVEAASDSTGEFITAPSFTTPVGRLVTVLVVGAVAGVLAAVRPARRAARRPVLEAIATE
jgi:putative ABC transport system permease protein